MIQSYRQGFADGTDKMPFNPTGDAEQHKEYERGYLDANKGYAKDFPDINFLPDDNVVYEDLKAIENS